MKHALKTPLLLFLAGSTAMVNAAGAPGGGYAEYPRVETFVGYSYLRMWNTIPLISPLNLNGGHVDVAYNFTRHWSFVVDLGGYASVADLRGFEIDNTVATFLGGPRLSFRKTHMVSPFIHALFGVAYGSAAIEVPNEIIVDNTVNPPLIQRTVDRFSAVNTKFAMMYGGGLDIRARRWLALRPFQVDYLWTRFGNPLFNDSDVQHNLRASAGVVFRFGGEKPLPPPPPAKASRVCPDGTTVGINDPCPKLNMTVALMASSTDVCQGETVNITPQINAKSTNGLRYQWVVDGNPVSQTSSFSFNTAGLPPGQHRVGLTVAGDAYNPASGDVAINVKEYRPPSGTVTANPPEIAAGERSTLSASFTGECGGAIREPVYTASEGIVRGNEFECTGIAFGTTGGEQRKAVTITATASDDRQSGTATTMVSCVQKGAGAAIRLPDILFPANSARVNNCGKRVLLEQLRSYFDRDPGGKAVIVGHQAESERTANLADSRAKNAAAIITAGSDVCLSLPADQVLVNAAGTDQQGVDFQPNFCGASAVERPGQTVSANDRMASYRRVVVWFIPSGGQVPASVTNYQTASALSLGALGCPK